MEFMNFDARLVIHVCGEVIRGYINKFSDYDTKDNKRALIDKFRKSVVARGRESILLALGSKFLSLALQIHTVTRAMISPQIVRSCRSIPLIFFQFSRSVYRVKFCG